MSEEPGGIAGQRAFEQASPEKPNKSLARSFYYAACGVREAARERNFKIDGAFSVVALLLCAVLQVPAWGWAAVVVCIGLQLAMETANTALEAAVDLASPQLHPLAKRAKDCAAGAALITAGMSLVVGGIVYVPAFIALISL